MGGFDINEMLKQLLPPLGIFGAIGIMWFVKLNIDRIRYAKKAENHILAIEVPSAGKLSFELVPIERLGGVDCIRYPRKGDAKDYPIHLLKDFTLVPCEYPINKMKYVQTTVQAGLWLGGDSEPLSNLRDIPVISASYIIHLIQGIATSTEETLQTIKAESTDQKIKKASGLLWVYIVLGIVLVGVIVTVVLEAKNSGLITELSSVIKNALGLQ